MEWGCSMVATINRVIGTKHAEEIEYNVLRS